MIQNKCLEISLPNSKVWRLVFKNDIVSFLCFQIHHAPIIKISMKKGCPKTGLACKIYW
jgi:hypothetical protein